MSNQTNIMINPDTDEHIINLIHSSDLSPMIIGYDAGVAGGDHSVAINAELVDSSPFPAYTQDAQGMDIGIVISDELGWNEEAEAFAKLYDADYDGNVGVFKRPSGIGKSTMLAAMVTMAAAMERSSVANTNSRILNTLVGRQDMIYKVRESEEVSVRKDEIYLELAEIKRSIKNIKRTSSKTLSIDELLTRQKELKLELTKF